MSLFEGKLLSAYSMNSVRSLHTPVRLLNGDLKQENVNLFSYFNGGSHVSTTVFTINNTPMCMQKKKEIRSELVLL